MHWDCARRAGGGGTLDSLRLHRPGAGPLLISVVRVTFFAGVQGFSLSSNTIKSAVSL